MISNKMTRDELLTQSLQMENARDFGADRIGFLGKVFKEVICECVYRVYEKSLINIDTEKYSESLRSVVRESVLDCLSEATRIDQVEAMLENASPYVTGMFGIAEEIALRHDPVIAKKDNGTYLVESAGEYLVFNEMNDCIGHIENVSHDDPAKLAFSHGLISFNEAEDSQKSMKPIDDKAVLDKVDQGIIDKWEKDIGSDIYANALINRVVDVYRKEEEAAAKQQEHIAQMTDTLSDIKAGNKENPDEELTSEEAGEVVEEAISVENLGPKSLFNSIFINKSRAVLSESAEFTDIQDHAKEIMDETICTYTLLETIHSLGIKTYSMNDKINLCYQFSVN